MPKPKKTKNPFAELPSEFRSAIEGGSDEDIKDVVAKTALDNQVLLEAKEEDLDLKDKLEQAKEAGAVYAEGVKMNKLKIRYAKFILSSRGKM